MITVSLQPFAFRKIAIFVAALLWLTATVLFADPVLMNARAERFARHAGQRNANTLVAATSAVPTRNAATHQDAEQTKLTPAEGPGVHSISFERLDSWSEFAGRPAAADAELTFWSFSLAH